MKVYRYSLLFKVLSVITTIIASVVLFPIAYTLSWINIWFVILPLGLLLMINIHLFRVFTYRITQFKHELVVSGIFTMRRTIVIHGINKMEHLSFSRSIKLSNANTEIKISRDIQKRKELLRSIAEINNLDLVALEQEWFI